MLAPERQKQILAILEERGTVRTVDLAEEFQVTDETIRRDLQALCEGHRLTRIHGGASSLSGRPKLQSFTERRSLRVESKRAIARVAREWIQPGRTYAFDSSTTGFALVSTLPDLPYRVVTNAYAVLDHLIGLRQVDVVAAGGRYHRKTHTFVGGESLDVLRRHNINTAFISCIGLDLKRGASEGFAQQAAFKERLVDLAEEVVLLVDSSKFNRRSDYFFAGFGDLSRIITDEGADPESIEILRGHGLPVDIAPTRPEPATPAAAPA